MRKMILALLLALTAATVVRAGAPVYFDEARVPLTVQEVRNDSRYADMAAWFGLPRDVFKTHEGYVENLPAGADGKFRWGQCMDKPYQWPSVTPQESAKMPGVKFNFPGGFFLHPQKGIDGNAILFYGKMPRVIIGPQGPQGEPGESIVGPQGPRGPRGPQGPPGQTTIIPQPVIYNISYNLMPSMYPSGQMLGVYGPSIYQYQLVGFSTVVRQNQPISINVSNANTNVNANNNAINIGDGSAEGSASGAGDSTATAGDK